MSVCLSSQTRFNIKFGQVYLTRPNVVENDSSNQPLFPQEARLRNLTYAAPLMVDIAQEILDGEQREDGTMDWIRRGPPAVSKVPLARVSMTHDPVFSRR